MYTCPFYLQIFCHRDVRVSCGLHLAPRQIAWLCLRLPFYGFQHMLCDATRSLCWQANAMRLVICIRKQPCTREAESRECIRKVRLENPLQRIRQRVKRTLGARVIVCYIVGFFPSYVFTAACSLSRCSLLNRLTYCSVDPSVERSITNRPIARSACRTL